MKTEHPLLHRTHSMCVLINHPAPLLGERALLRSSSHCPWSLALMSEERLWFPRTDPILYSSIPLTSPGFYQTVKLYPNTTLVFARVAWWGEWVVSTHRVDSAFCFIQPSWWGRLKDTRGGKRDTQGENHTPGTHLHRKGSMLISRAEQGMFSSNLVITSGWRTPSLPTLWPLAKTSAHRPGKKAGPARQKEENQCFSRQTCQ